MPPLDVDNITTGREACEFYWTPRGQVPNYVNGYAVQSLAHSMPFDARGAAEFYSAVKLLKQELWLQSHGRAVRRRR